MFRTCLQKPTLFASSFGSCDSPQGLRRICSRNLLPQCRGLVSSLLSFAIFEENFQMLSLQGFGEYSMASDSVANIDAKDMPFTYC